MNSCSFYIRNFPSILQFISTSIFLVARIGNTVAFLAKSWLNLLSAQSDLSDSLVHSFWVSRSWSRDVFWRKFNGGNFVVLQRVSFPCLSKFLWDSANQCIDVACVVLILISDLWSHTTWIQVTFESINHPVLLDQRDFMFRLLSISTKAHVALLQHFCFYTDKQCPPVGATFYGF